MDDLYDYYHSSGSDDKTKTDVSDAFLTTSKNKRVSPYRIVK